MKWLFFFILTLVGAFFYWRHLGSSEKPKPEASQAESPMTADDFSNDGPPPQISSPPSGNSAQMPEPIKPPNPVNSGEMGNRNLPNGDSAPLTVPPEFMAQPPNAYDPGSFDQPNFDAPLEPPPPPPQFFPENDSFNAIPPADGGGPFEPPPPMDDPNGGYAPPPPPPPIDEGNY